MKALYRRYRPTSLDDVIGQDQVIVPLKKALAAGKLSHAYVFVGPRGTGKTSVARILAHTINNFDYEIEDSYIDIIEIDGASNRGIDNIRELREKALIAPSQGKYKIYIIDEVHMLTTEAFNALLKLLEEPPEHVIFIMATTDAHKIPSTITSRSQIYTFQLSDQKTMTTFLRQVCDEEKIKITDDALDLLYQHGGGSFRDTLSLLDQISTLDSKEITAQTITSALGLADQALIDQLLHAYDQQDLNAIQSALADLIRTNTSTSTIANALVSTIIHDLQPAHLALLDDLIDITSGKTSHPEVSLLVALTRPLASTPTPHHPDPTPRHPELDSGSHNPSPHHSEPSTSHPEPSTSHSEPSTSQTIWQNILATARAKAPAIIAYLENSSFGVTNSVFYIYNNNDFHRKQLNKKRDLILAQLPENYQLEITAIPAAKDSPITNIQSIVGGGEVIKL